MKKLFLCIISLVLVLVPLKVEAKSYNFNGYYCDQKVDQGNGTFKETCHILVTSDFDIDHIKLNLILKNLVLESVKTSSDWSNLNGLSNSMEFTAASSHRGSFSVADLTFVGNNSDEECEASIEPTLVEKKPDEAETMVCSIIDDVYYGKNGTKVTEDKYYEECCNYVCTVIDNNDKKYYFDSNGKSVDYDSFIKDCNTVEEPVIEACTIVDDKYYGKNKTLVSEAKYYEECFNYVCKVVNNKYYFNSKGENVSYDDYKNDCTTIQEGPQTGIDYHMIMVPFGLISMIVILKLAKKNTKIYKI